LRVSLAVRLEEEPACFTDVEVPLEQGFGFGKSVRATLTGPPRAPVVVVLGGISANRFVAFGASGVPGWWASLVAPGGGVDLDRFRVVGLDFAADPAGLTAPSTADQAEVVRAALDLFAIHRVHAIVGASYGGMVALAFAEAHPHRIGRLVAVSAGACPHPYATAMRELQRRVVDFGLRSGDPAEALSIARGLAMLTYRTPQEFEQRFSPGLASGDCLGTSAPGEYLRARGEDFLSVMSPRRFLSLSASIDRHQVDPARIETPALLVGAASDQLVPPVQLQSLHERLAGTSSLHLLPCLYGHDMFLKAPSELAALVKPFLEDGL
jgi:homoserine O-acetyltransferase